MDSSNTNGEEAYYFPDALSPTHTQHYLARQSSKQHSPAATWNSQHVYTTETETIAPAWPCCKNGLQPDPKRSPPRRIDSRKAPHWQAPITLQRCLQKGSEGLGHWHQRMGNLGFRTFRLEARSRVRPLRVWRDTCRTGWEKGTNEEAGCAKTIDDVRSSGSGRNLARTCKPLTWLIRGTSTLSER